MCCEFISIWMDWNRLETQVNSLQEYNSGLKGLLKL